MTAPDGTLELPDGMHITAWPLLGVRRGELWAPLSGDQVKQIDKTTLDASGVTIDLVSDRTWGSLVAAPSTVKLTLDTLRARLEGADGAKLLQRRRWDAAARAFDRAIALDPSFEDAYVQRAAARLALHQTPAAVESVASIAARNPVWLYWKVMADPSLAGLRTLPVITKLEASVPGTFDASGRSSLCNRHMTRGGCEMGVAEEPSGRFLVAFADWISTMQTGTAQLAGMKVIDRQLGRVIATLPFNSLEVNRHGEEFLAAQKMLRALGFVPAQGEAATVTYLDPEQGFPSHPVITFPQSGHVLALAADRRAAVAPQRFVVIEPPPGKTVTAAVRVGDIFLYRWSMLGIGDITIVPVPPNP